MLNLLACCAAQPDMFSGASMLHAPLTETARQRVSFVLRINPRRTRRRRGAHVCRGVCVCVHPAQSERASARQLCDACSCCAPPNSHEHANCGPSRFTSPELHAFSHEHANCGTSTRIVARHVSPHPSFMPHIPRVTILAVRGHRSIYHFVDICAQAHPLLRAGGGVAHPPKYYVMKSMQQMVVRCHMHRVTLAAMVCTYFIT